MYSGGEIMTQIEECEKEGCSNTFDIDNGEGVIVNKLEGSELTTHYYCCSGHRP